MTWCIDTWGWLDGELCPKFCAHLFLSDYRWQTWVGAAEATDLRAPEEQVGCLVPRMWGYFNDQELHGCEYIKAVASLVKPHWCKISFQWSCCQLSESVCKSQSICFRVASSGSLSQPWQIIQCYPELAKVQTETGIHDQLSISLHKKEKPA